MKRTCQSEVGKIETLYIKRVGDAFESDEKIEREWRLLNYITKPELSLAREEYRNFEILLEQNEINLHYFPQNNTVSLDSMYCRDASIVTDAGVILCNMGKPQRSAEPEIQGEAFVLNGVEILGAIKTPGTVEGGDVAWLDEKTLAVGQSYRTNSEGIAQLEKYLNPVGVQIITVPLPHHNGPGDVFHLMSVFSPVDYNLAVVYSPLMPIVFRNNLLDRGYSFVEVADEEFDSMGCNVLAVAPGKCLMVRGNPRTRKALERAGCIVLEYDGAEISLKGGGGPTCLTRPFWRIDS
jgi:N-dimethylarginine dimethylaminohydrolase